MKKWILICCLFTCVILCACQAKEANPLSTVTPVMTQTPVSTATLSPTSVPEYVLQGSDKEIEQRMISLVEDEECQSVVYFKSDNMISAIVSESDINVLPDNTVRGEGCFYVVIFDPQNDEKLLIEKRVAEDGFQAAFMQQQNRTYLSVISENQYCGIEYYDMNIYRVENGLVSVGKIAEDNNLIRWWQNYKPVLVSDGRLELYVRKTNTEDFTNELMKETILYHWDKVQTKNEEYAEKYAYVWEYAYSLEVAELDYSQERSTLTQSRIFSDVIEECLKPQKLNPTGEGDRFCGIICSTGGKENGYQLAVCKQLGSASVNGMENIAVILYDEQGRLVDSEYYMSDEASVSCNDKEIYVFARYNQQGYVETIVDGVVSEEHGKIKYSYQK